MTVVTWQSGCSACHLRAFGLCQAVQDSRGAACLQSVRQPARFYPPGRTVFAQGSQNVPLYNVLSGWLFSYQLLPDGRRQILQFLLPGDIVGLDPGGAAGIPHGLETLSEAVLCAIPPDGFHRLCACCPAVAERCRGMMARDINLLFERLATLGRRMARERVVHLLMELAVRSSGTTQFADGTSLRMPLTQPIMADALGLTAIHVNRVLRELRHEGILELNHKMLTILDSETLTCLGGFPEGLFELWTQPLPSEQAPHSHAVAERTHRSL